MGFIRDGLFLYGLSDDILLNALECRLFHIGGTDNLQWYKIGILVHLGQTLTGQIVEDIGLAVGWVVNLGINHLEFIVGRKTVFYVFELQFAVSIKLVQLVEWNIQEDVGH